MSRRLYGIRYTTGCGHSWRKRHRVMTARVHRFCTMDCRVCGELLITDAEQFDDRDDSVPLFEVHMPLFHPYVHARNPRWPADGAGAGYIEFSTD